MWIIALLLMGDVGQEYSNKVYDRVDLIILNHVYAQTSNGLMRLELDQVIYLDFVEAEGEYIVVDWRNCKSGRKKYTAKARRVAINKMKKDVWDEWKLVAGDNNFIPEWYGNNQVPRFNPITNRYETVFNDATNKCIRHISSTTFQEISTDYDLERHNLTIYPLDTRRKLGQSVHKRSWIPLMY